MAGNEEEDDKPTVVLDLKALQEEAKQEQEALDDISSELEFTAGTGSLELPEWKQEIVLFDFNSEYFQKAHTKFPKNYDYAVIKTLPQLNQKLSAEGLKVILFNYNAAPKAVNQLCAQIREKFPQTRTVILAKNLSPEKAQVHKAGKSGADGYISTPFNLSTLESELNKVMEL